VNDIIKIGIFTSEETQAIIIEEVKKYDNVEPVWFTYKKPEDAIENVKYIKNVDGVFCSGLLPYLMITGNDDQISKPIVYKEYGALEMSLAFLYLCNSENLKGKTISIDCFEAWEIETILNICDIDSVKYFYKLIRYERNKLFNTQEFIDYHVDLFKRDKVDYVITQLSAVATELRKLGIPVYRAPRNVMSYTLSFRDLISMTIASKLQNAQIVCAMISVTELTEKQVKYLSQFASSNYASFENIDEDNYQMFMTRTSLERITNGYREFGFKDTSFDYSIGFGIGKSMAEAINRAEAALSMAKDSIGKSSFVLNEIGEMIGPLGEAMRNTLTIANDNITYKISRDTNIGILNINKILEFFVKNKFEVFTSEDLSLYLDVTLRSAERFIKKLVEQEYIYVSGKELRQVKGRPRNIYSVSSLIIKS
jgi:hypothetical protein